MTSIPKYMKIYYDLISKLDSKEYDFGDMLPSEKDLCVTYKTSRMTVNKVIQMLVFEGRVKRIRGKGTFVIEPQVKKDITSLTSFTEDMNNIGKNPGSTMLEYSMNFDVSSEIKEKLDLDESDFTHIIKRIRTADGQAVALDIDNISSKIAKNIDVDKINTSLYSYFEKYLKIDISYSDFTIMSANATKDIAKYLGIEPGEPVIYMRHITYTKKGLPFEYCQTYYRADKYSLSIRAYR